MAWAQQFQPNQCFTPLLITGILTSHVCLLAYSSLVHSPTLGEVYHLPAGLSHLYRGRFDLFRVNPPLVRSVAAIPVALLSPETDWQRYNDSLLVRSEAEVAADFLNANGPRSLWFFIVARWACIPFSIAGGCICFRWARDLHGTSSGLLALILWCFCPYILGHASLITPDAHAAAMGICASYAFWLWLRKFSWESAFIAGLLLGLAELSKSTLLVLYPIFPAMWVIYRMSTQHGISKIRWSQDIRMFASIIVISVLVINVGYGFEGTFCPLGEYYFQSQLFNGIEANADSVNLTGNRFSNTWMASLPVPLPMNYLQGIDTQRMDFEEGLSSYLNGQRQIGGWWYYYLYALVIKMPLGTLFLMGLAICVTIFGHGKNAPWCNEIIVLMPGLVILVFVSSQTGFSIHSRYVLPVLPFFFIWISKVARAFKIKKRVFIISTQHPPRYIDKWCISLASLASNALVIIATTCSIGSCLWAYPHSLSYYNELIGGPKNGHYHLLNSNTSWGQDLYFLKRWYDDNCKYRPLYLAYFGFLDPRLSGIEFTIPSVGPQVSLPQSCANAGMQGPLPGWYAIDVNHLQGVRLPAPDGRGGWRMIADNDHNLTFFQHFEPVAMAGYSIYIYHISLDDANQVRRELNLPLLTETDVNCFVNNGGEVDVTASQMELGGGKSN